jgi:hypothetical protein
MTLKIDPAEAEITAIRAQGAGGQNVKTFRSSEWSDPLPRRLPRQWRFRIYALIASGINDEGTARWARGSAVTAIARWD